jgi:hypothetical protein
MFAHIASTPQSGDVAHSSTSVQVAGEPVVVAPVKPVGQPHSHEPAVLVQVAFAPQIPLVAHSSRSTHTLPTQSRASPHCEMSVQLVGQDLAVPSQT